MMRLLFLIVILCMKVLLTRGQCDAIDVNLPSEVCREGYLLIENNSPAVSFEWDFCPVDLRSTPSVSNIVNTGVSSTIDLAFAEHNNEFFGFAADAGGNSVVRLDFGASRDNVPLKTNLGNVNGLFDFPNSIAMFQQGAHWFAAVANANNSKVILLDFGESLRNAPTASVLHTRAGAGFASLAIVPTSGDGCVLLMAEINARHLKVLNYPQGLAMPSDAEQIIPIAGSSPIDLQVVAECGNWTVLMLSVDDRKLYRVGFGASFLDPPVVSSYGLTFGFEAYRLSLVREGANFYGFVASAAGGVTRLDFGHDLMNEPTVNVLGTFGVLSNSRSVIIDSRAGEWRGFMINFSDGNLYRLSFQGNCGVSEPFSNEPAPEGIKYTVAGEHELSVTAFNEDGTVSDAAYQITVREQVATQFTIQQTNACANHEVYFEARTTGGEITDYQWDFGDGQTSSLANPAHVYPSADNYIVSLLATDANACLIRQDTEISIFEKPISAFSLPSVSPSCTNQAMDFVNTSVFEPNSQPYWRWFVNSVEVSGDMNLSYAFETPGPHRIKLIAGISGCESQSEQELGPLAEGPNPDFDYTGICLGQGTVFQNTSTGDIDAFEWDFGDGNVSEQQNPTHLFSDFGSFDVRLTATGATGCDVERKKIIQIRSVPVVEFQVAEPPLSCSGTPAQFVNLSGNPDGGSIAAWHWDFDDDTGSHPSSEQHPQHLFATAGVYDVSLLARTESGCEASELKQITIHASPPTTFTHSPTCEDLPVLFDLQSADIASSYWEIGTSYYLVNSPTHTFAAPGDYRLYLEIVGNNGCVSALNQTIRVPVPLSPDFSVDNSCVGETAVLTDLTSGVDPVAARLWKFNGDETLAGPTVTHTFSQPGTTSVGLTVTTQSGCAYEVSRIIEIAEPPVAGFVANPSSGAFPLEVAFANTSSGATESHWEFGDGSGSTSDDESPVYTFAGQGNYIVSLTVSNTQGCHDSFSDVITTAAPLPDVDIDVINITTNLDGSAKLIVTIHNKGNTVLKELPVEINFDGALALRQMLPEVLLPDAKYNFVLNTAIVDISRLRYICVSLRLDDDLSPAGNRVCKEFVDNSLILPAFPNPTIGIVNLEWIVDIAKTMQITLTDKLGRQIFNSRLQSVTGFNYHKMDLSLLERGVYILTIDDGTSKSTQRIVLVGER